MGEAAVKNTWELKERMQWQRAEGGGRTWRHPNRPYVHLWKQLLSSAKEGEDKDQREGR